MQNTAVSTIHLPVLVAYSLRFGTHIPHLDDQYRAQTNEKTAEVCRIGLIGQFCLQTRIRLVSNHAWYHVLTEDIGLTNRLCSRSNHPQPPPSWEP